MSTTTVFIACPAYDGIKSGLFYSLMGLTASLHKERINHSILLSEGNSLIVDARNQIAGQFLKRSHEWLLMVDNDITFEPDSILKMMRSGHKFIAQAIPMRKINTDSIDLAIKMGAKGNLSRYLPQWNVSMFDSGHETGAKATEAIEMDGMIRIQSIGTALVLVHRSVIEQMAATYPELEYEAEGLRVPGLFNPIVERETKRLLGEDISFSKRWTDIGGEIWCYTNATVTHTGPVGITGNLSHNLLDVSEVDPEVLKELTRKNG